MAVPLYVDYIATAMRSLPDGKGILRTTVIRALNTPRTGLESEDFPFLATEIALLQIRYSPLPAVGIELGSVGGLYVCTISNRCVELIRIIRFLPNNFMSSVNP